MSVINQTLRELDARQPASPTGEPAAVQTVVPLARPSRQNILRIVGALALALAASAAWLGLRAPDVDPVDRQRDAVASAADAPATPAPSVTLPIAPPAVSGNPAVDPTVDPVAPPSPVAATPVTPASVAATRVESTALPAAQVEPSAAAVRPAPVAGPIAGPAVDVAPAPAPRAETALRASHAASPGPDADASDRAARRPASISKEAHRLTPDEEAEDRYRKALTLLNKGRDDQARPLLDDALKLAPGHVAARQVLATLLDEAGLRRDAEQLVRAGRSLHPDNAWFASSLARLQAARGDLDAAAASLKDGLDGRGVTAEYRAAYAAILSRLKKPVAAAEQYERALARQPGQGAWWMGLGLALAEQGRLTEARAAYGRALDAGNLDDGLAAFVRAKLAE